MNTRYTGKVVWFDQRDGIGIIKTEDGTKFYTDISAVEEIIKSGDIVSFEHNENILDCLCAYRVKLSK